MTAIIGSWRDVVYQVPFVFSQAVEYSLRAMVLLTEQVTEPMTAIALAERGQIPAPYLSKLLQALVKAGLVSSQRGLRGGYLLTKHPSEITMADIVNVAEPMQRITQCPLGLRGHVQLCPLHRKFDFALAIVEEAFQKTTLEDLRKENNGLFPLCTPQSIINLELGIPKHQQSS